MPYKLLLKKGDIELYIKDNGQVKVWDKKSECEAFRLSIEGCERLAGYEIIKEEC